MNGDYVIEGLSVTHDGALNVVLTAPDGEALQMQATAGSPGWRSLLVVVKDAVYANTPLTRQAFDALCGSVGVTLGPYSKEKH